MKMKCQRCNNTNPEYFYRGSKGLYCRRCIRFKRVLIEEKLNPISYSINPSSHDLSLSFPLTKYQLAASDRCLEEIRRKDVLLHCVCGAGKTEIVTSTISRYLSEGKRVCYAIPRKEVVIELALRFQKMFPKAKVVAVYGGHHEDIIGDIVICTTHQLYRYYQCFELLILDEVDAFPFKGDEVLHNIAKNTCIGRIIYSTATINEELSSLVKDNQVSLVTLPLRPHLKPLIEPNIYFMPKIFILVYLYLLMKRSKRQMIIFVSSKKLAKNLYQIYRHLFSCTYVYSDLKMRSGNINAFKEHKYQYIFATTVLERGVTIKGVSVVILNMHKGVFDEASLVQMLGRVGRSINDPNGEAYILSNIKERAIMDCQRSIRQANDDALYLLRSKA